MKFLSISDTHFRFQRPRCRIDKNYLETQGRKWLEIEQLAVAEQAYILHGGDFADDWDQSDLVKEMIYKNMLIENQDRRIGVYGQHDLRNHKFRDNTTLGVTVAAKLMKIAITDPIVIDDEVAVYGASWNEEVPQIITPELFNVLITHRMIIGDNLVWEGQDKYVQAKNFITDTRFDLIVSGDNHATFVCGVGNQTLINSGSLMRARVDQFNHRPCVFLFDTNTRSFTQYFLKITPSSDCIDKTAVETKAAESQRLQLFTEALATREDETGLDFEQNMRKEIADSQVEDDVAVMTWEIIKYAKEN